MSMKLATIVANTEKKASGEAIIFVAEPSPEQERLAGKLFAIIEIEAKKSDAKSIANFIVDRVNLNYYENEKLALRSRIEDLKIENIFETVLVKTNSDLVDFLVNRKISVRPQDVNITIGIIYENQIHFSNTGKNKPLLLHREDDGRYTMINIKCDDHESAREYNLKKIFSSIISGEIPNKSYFIFANESLSEYLFNKEIIDIISKLAPAGAAEQAKNTLLRLNIQAPFLGIIIKNSGGHDEYDLENYQATQNIEKQNYSAAATTNNDLKTMEQNTAAILSSGGVVSTERIKEGVKNIIRDSRTINAIGDAGKRIIDNARRPKSDITATTTIDKEFLNDGSPKKKIFKLATIILGIAVVIFAGSLLFKNQSNTKIETQQRVKTQKEIIEQKENQIDSYLLYKNENGAKEILIELKTIIEALKDSDIENITNYAQLLEKYQAQSDEINHVQKIIPLSLKSLINFSDISADAVVDNISIVSDGSIKKIYAVANNKKTIYKRNLNDNVNGVISSDKIKSGSNYPLLDAKNNLIYYIDQGQITKLNTKSDQLEFINLKLAADKNPVGISIYNDKLYLFEKSERKLLKFSLTNGAYDKAEARLNLDINNADINNFAIDLTGIKSDVYLLKNTGVILKYYDGKQQPFNLAAIEPALNSAISVKVLKNIYVLDQQGKRVIAFDKSGKMIKQYQSNDLSELKDFAVDEANNTLYLLNGNTVLETSLK